MSFLTRTKEDYHFDHYFLFLGNFQFLLHSLMMVSPSLAYVKMRITGSFWLVGADLTHHHHHFSFLVVSLQVRTFQQEP